MEYYILEQDRWVHNTIKIPVISLFRNAEYRNLDLTSLPRMTLLRRTGSEYESYPDLLGQMFLVSEKLNEVISLFLPGAEYKLFCFWDQQKNKDFYYYAYSPRLIDCLSEKSVLSGNNTIVKRAVIKRDTVQDVDIFRAGGLNTHLVLVSLPVAEAILRRNLKGLRLWETYFDDEEVTISDGKNNIGRRIPIYKF